MPMWRDDRREEEWLTVPVRRVAPAWPATRGENRIAGAGIGDIKAAAPADSASSAAPFASIEELFESRHIKLTSARCTSRPLKALGSELRQEFDFFGRESTREEKKGANAK